MNKATLDFGENGFIGITPGSEQLHIIEGGLTALPIWDPSKNIWKIGTTLSIPPTSSSYQRGAHFSTNATTFTEEDRDRMVKIETLLEELGKEIKQLLKRK